MSRKYLGGIKFPGLFLSTAQLPIDDRMVVLTKEELWAADTWKVGTKSDGAPTWYEGMLVSVLDEDALYILVNNGQPLPVPTDQTYWKKVGADISLTGKTITVVNAYKYGSTTESGFFDKTECDYDSTTETYTAKESATEITDTTVTTEGEGLYVVLDLGAESGKVYLKSTDLVDLRDYAKIVDVNASLGIRDASIDMLDTSIKSILDNGIVTSIAGATDSSYVSLAPTNASNGNVIMTISAEVAEACDTSADIEAANNKLISGKYLEQRAEWVVL